ncbi:MAG: TonB-dependent receptor [Pyrinomonadaceae bacterium]
MIVNFVFLSSLRWIALPLLFAASAAAQALSGVVVDTRGDAVAEAEVILENGSVADRTVSGKDGSFSFASSTGRLSVSASGFERVMIQIDRERAAPLTIVLQPSPVTGNVNVSVTRTETQQDNTAASIAVITIESLAVTAARTVDDTVRQIPGFQLFRRSSSRTTNPTAQGANLRGLAGSGASRTTVLFDGLSINDAFGGWTYWSRVPLIAVEQIEVFRGGASSFYGSGGLSGAVNIVPFSLTDEKVILKAETSVASQNTADFSGALLASRGKWEADLIGDIFKTAGYIPVEQASRGRVDTRASSRHSNLILKLGRRFNENNRAFIRGNLFGERRDNGTSLTNNRTYFRQLAFGADLASQRYGEFTARAFAERQVYDQTFSAVSADRDSETLTRLQRVPSSALGASALWQKKFARHSVAASADILQTRGFSDEVGFFNGLSTSVSRSGGEARDLSLFVQDKWDVVPRVTLNLSVRVDERRNSDGITTTRTLATGTIAETRFPDRNDPSFSPRIAAIYDVNENLSVYASFARSFRAPSLNELYRGFRVGNIVTEANAFLTPERANTFEAGGSVTFRDPTFITRAGVYRARVVDPIVSVTIATTPTVITRQRQNIGETRSQGFEFDTQFWPTTTIKLNAGYLFVDAKISDFPASPDLDGRTLPQVARHNFTAQVLYEFRTRWKVSTQLRASSSQFEDDRNTLLLGGYFTADARVSYQFPYFVEAFAAVENVFGSRYDIGRTPVRTVAAPRSVRLGLRFNSFRR